jgi:hypothetical protein
MFFGRGAHTDAASGRLCEMIFISAETIGYGVFFETLVNTTVWRSHE